MTGNERQAEGIKQAVREYYGAHARKAGEKRVGAIQSAACCSEPSAGDVKGTSGGGSCCSAPEALELPDEAFSSACGCGNPVAMANLKAGEVVLDLGSGGGLDVLNAARIVGPKGHVYGLDMTDGMLELARSNAAKVGAENVEFLKGEIEDIPLPEKSVDVIISNCVINLSPEKGQALEEAFRVLRPGGRLAVSDVVVDGDLEGLPLSEEQIRVALSWAGCLAGALTVDQYRQFLGRAGFQDVAIDVQHLSTLPSDLSSVPAVLKTLTLADLEAIVARFAIGSIRAKRAT